LKQRLTVIETQEKYGLVFAYFGEGMPPALSFEMLNGDGGHWVPTPEVWPCSFFLRLENTLDIAHVQSAHRYSGVAQAVQDYSHEIQDRETGICIRLTGGPVVVYEEPNRLSFPVPISNNIGWRDILCFRVPIDSSACVSFTVAQLPRECRVPEMTTQEQPFSPSSISNIGEQVLSGRRQLSDLTGTENLTEIEDYVMLVSIQRNTTRREHLADFDAPIRLLRKKWAKAASSVEG
jgi:phenylpropionate dioxygenase-like ring-hydroxylating dioxygenase large terminal subunit